MEVLPNLSRIKYLRKKLNISQKELGEKLDISQSTISRIENGDMDPPYSKVKKIIEFLENERMMKKRSKKHAEDIMTPKIISITPDSTIKEVITLMSKYNFSQIPILEKNHNFGSITAKKIQKHITKNPDLINADILTIIELPFPEVEKNWNAKDISNLLIKYPAVLVKENNKFIGIISDADFLKLTSK